MRVEFGLSAISWGDKEYEWAYIVEGGPHIARLHILPIGEHFLYTWKLA